MKPRILSLDLETTPLEAYAWGPKYECNLIEIIEHSRILSYSAKWLDGKHITKGWPDYKGYKKETLDDKAIVKDLWELVNQADIIIAQNGRDFDVKVMNARFLAHRLPPPAPYKLIDPKVEAKKYLRLPSYSLDDLCDYFNIGRKMEHEGFGLWLKCIAGDKFAWNRMKAYNKNDVIIMEKLYLILRPYMKSHPNLGMFTGKVVCGKCGSSKIQARGLTFANTVKYHRWQCMDCGGWGREAVGEVNVDALRNL